MLTIEKHPRDVIPQCNQSSQDSMPVTIQFREASTFITEALRAGAGVKCTQLGSGWVLVTPRGRPWSSVPGSEIGRGAVCRRLKIFIFHL